MFHSKSHTTPTVTALILVGFSAVILAIVGIPAYYRASVQAEVYRREGIQMSTWEVLWGAKPAERSVILK